MISIVGDLLLVVDLQRRVVDPEPLRRALRREPRDRPRVGAREQQRDRRLREDGQDQYLEARDELVAVVQNW